MRTVSVRAKGKVQGVFFRKFVLQKAIQLDIRGTVENTPEGDVLIYASGEEKALEEFIRSCRSGPPHARVDELIIDTELPQAIYTHFSIRR